LRRDPSPGLNNEFDVKRWFDNVEVSEKQLPERILNEPLNV
jgi:hypothetical protein